MTEVLFNLFDLFVNQIFGGIFVSIIGIGIMLLVILVVGRVPLTFILFWMFFYFMVTITLYFGAIGMVFAFILVAGGLIYNLIRSFGGNP